MSAVTTPNVHLQAPEDDGSHTPNWNDPPDELSRSPRPYGRKPKDNATPSSPLSRTNSYLPSPALTPSQSDTDLTRRVPLSRLPSRLELATPGESGAEADDESFKFVKALPPPQSRVRKGLKWESELDSKGANAKETKADTADDAKKSRYSADRLVARERLLQRACEAACLSSLACVTAGSSYFSNHGVRTTDSSCATWLLLYMSVLAIVVSILLARRYRQSLQGSSGIIDLLGRIDPAPVFYPTTIPILVTITLGSGSTEALLVNMVLGLSTIPRRLVSSTAPSAESGLHWAISLAPCILSHLLNHSQSLHESRLGWLQAVDVHQTSSFDLSLLFPMHQALLSPIRYLTTSSLLSSEQQLLSVALINLLILVVSPQMVILKYILWVGGFGLFFLCRPVLKWNVALERIPTWRFRRAGVIVRASQTFFSTLTEGIKGPPNPENVLGSDVEDDHQTSDGVLAESTKKRGKHGSRLGLSEMPTASTPVAESPQSKAKKRKPSSTIQSYLNLTPAQVNLRKWAYAIYTYIVVIALVLGPIRYLIQQYALAGTEPFSWAINYLFSDIPVVANTIYQPPLSSHFLLPRFDQVPPSDYTSTWSETIDYHLHYPRSATRLTLLAYWASIVATGVAIVITLSERSDVDTRRKVFHFTMVALLLPTAYVDPAYLSLGLILVLTVFLLLELLRAAQLRPLSKPLAQFLSPYVDGRDLRGPIVVSHIFLLIGCAIPYWLSLAALPFEQGVEEPWFGWTFAKRDVSMLSGVICVGMGDAAASLVGRAIGRHKWPWPGGKSLEGSAAFALAVIVGLVIGKSILVAGGWDDVNPLRGDGINAFGILVAKAAVAACGASLTEAVLTGCNDNVVVPVVLWLWVRGLRM